MVQFINAVSFFSLLKSLVQYYHLMSVHFGQFHTSYLNWESKKKQYIMNRTKFIKYKISDVNRMYMNASVRLPV